MIFNAYTPALKGGIENRLINFQYFSKFIPLKAGGNLRAKNIEKLSNNKVSIK